MGVRERVYTQEHSIQHGSFEIVGQVSLALVKSTSTTNLPCGFERPVEFFLSDKQASKSET